MSSVALSCAMRRTEKCLSEQVESADVSNRGEPFEARYYTPYRQRISAAMLRGGRRRGPPR